MYENRVVDYGHLPLWLAHAFTTNRTVSTLFCYVKFAFHGHMQTNIKNPPTSKSQSHFNSRVVYLLWPISPNLSTMAICGYGHLSSLFPACNSKSVYRKAYDKDDDDYIYMVRWLSYHHQQKIGVLVDIECKSYWIKS